MAKLQSTEIVGVANRPATICANTMCIWFDTINLLPMASYCAYAGTGIWSAGGALSVARYTSTGGGLQSAAFIAAGFGNTVVSCTEEYSKALLIVDCYL